MTLTLRPYQAEAIEAGNNYTGKAGIIALPTGAGKSIVIASMVDHALQQGQRVLNAIHNGELVRQNGTAIERLTGRKVGIVSASVGRNDHARDAVVCSVGSAYRTIREMGVFDVVIIDECHLVSASGSTMYGKLLDGVRHNNPDMTLIGQTATPWRMDGPLIGGGLWQDMIFDGCSSERFKGMVDDGYLAPLVAGPKRVIDFSGVRTGGNGDYREDDSGHKIEPILPQLIQDMLSDSIGRRKGLVFCPTVRTAEMAVELLRGHGQQAQVVTGATPKGERKQIIDSFRAGTGGRWLVSVSALTTGFDVPDVDVLCILRPTKSSALHVQMLGRGTRVHLDKTDCLVLDYAGNVERCGPIDAPIIPERVVRGGGPVPTRTCPMCEQQCHASARVCPTCGYEFELRKIGGSLVANAENPMSSMTVRKMEGAVPVILPPTRDARTVIDKSGRLWCRLSWSDRVSVLVDSKWATALGLHGSAEEMVHQAVTQGTKPAMATLTGSGEYGRLKLGRGDADMADLYWCVTTTPQLRGLMRRMIMGEHIEQTTVTRACTAAGVGYKFGHTLPGLAEIIRKNLAKKGDVTIDAFDSWVQSLLERK